MKKNKNKEKVMSLQESMMKAQKNLKSTKIGKVLGLVAVGMGTFTLATNVYFAVKNSNEIKQINEQIKADQNAYSQVIAGKFQSGEMTFEEFTAENEKVKDKKTFLEEYESEEVKKSYSKVKGNYSSSATGACIGALGVLVGTASLVLSKFSKDESKRDIEKLEILMAMDEVQKMIEDSRAQLNIEEYVRELKVEKPEKYEEFRDFIYDVKKGGAKEIEK